MIFIIGNSKDLVEPVINHLREISNEEVVIFKADLCLENEGVGFSFINKQTKTFADIGISEYVLNNVESVWFWKPVLPKVLREYSPKDFWKYCGKEMIVKTLTTSLHGDRIVFTNKVDEDFMNKIDRLKSSPVIFQKLIKKKLELRITVVDDNVFAAAVKSPAKIDWRRGLGEASMFELPRDIRQFCVDYVSELGLRFGCIDMIITPDDEYCFLEINPNGQWKFIEQRTKFPIGKAIARALISK